MVGYVLSGNIGEIVDQLSQEIAKTKPHTNLSRVAGTRDAQYKSIHTRTLDGESIMLHHLFFNFAA